MTYTVIVDAFVPDYDNECEKCGASPCVVAIRHSQPIFETNMCWPCTFGKDKAEGGIEDG